MKNKKVLSVLEEIASSLASMHEVMEEALRINREIKDINSSVVDCNIVAMMSSVIPVLQDDTLKFLQCIRKGDLDGAYNVYSQATAPKKRGRKPGTKMNPTPKKRGRKPNANK